MEPVRGFEPLTCGLRNRCSATELHRPSGGTPLFSHPHGYSANDIYSSSLLRPFERSLSPRERVGVKNPFVLRQSAEKHAASAQIAPPVKGRSRKACLSARSWTPQPASLGIPRRSLPAVIAERGGISAPPGWVLDRSQLRYTFLHFGTGKQESLLLGAPGIRVAAVLHRSRWR